MYSPTATLTDVLFYTPTDGYNYLTDNRPIYQLDTNIRALASSLIGVGYGEHASVSGDILTPGKGVELLSNGLIRYPDSSTVSNTAILGLVIGSAGAGLTKVIWSANLLDLDIIGLAGIISGATTGQYLKVDTNITGNIILVTSIGSSDLIVGQVKKNTYITIGKNGQNTVSSDITPQRNYSTNFGVTRKRNLQLLSSLDSTPIQYTKSTLYQDDLGLTYNPVSIKYNSSTGQLSAADSVPSAVYGANSASWILRQSYTQFKTNEVVQNESVLITAQNNPSSTFRSSWSSIAFPSILEDGALNYELQQVGSSGLDYSSSGNLNIYKDFYIYKYYQYARVTNLSDPLYGKVTAIVTVLDSKNIQTGGEQGKILICDFFTYNSSSGRETTKNRAIVTGVAADTLYNNTDIFPSIIKA